MSMTAIQGNQESAASRPSTGFVQRGHAGILTVPAQGFGSDAEITIIRDVLDRWRTNPDIYCVVLRIAQQDIHRPTQPAEAASLGSAEYWIARHELVWQADRLPKPLVAVLDGPHDGLAAAIASIATHRVALPGYAFAVADVRQGLPPALGLTARLARLPGHLGTYLALSGRPLAGPDAQAAKLVTHSLTVDAMSEVLAGLADADCVDPLLDGRHIPPGVGALAPYLRLIATALAAQRLGDMIAVLRAETGALGPWARALADTLEPIDPLVGALTLAMLRRPRRPRLKTALEEDMRALTALAGLRAGVSELPPERWLDQPGGHLLTERDFIPTVPATTR